MKTKKRFKSRKKRLNLNLVYKIIIILGIVCLAIVLFLLALPSIFKTIILTSVESSSMSHQMKITGNNYELRLCKFNYSEQKSVDFNEYWNACGYWYENINISKQDFSGFPLKDGFEKGDIIVVLKTSELKLGDIIVFEKNSENKSKPIIHRIISIEEYTIQTKGDSNLIQFQTPDEKNIPPDQIIGKAVLRIPLLGWPKIWFEDLKNKFLSFKVDQISN